MALASIIPPAKSANQSGPLPVPGNKVLEELFNLDCSNTVSSECLSALALSSMPKNKLNS